MLVFGGEGELARRSKELAPGRAEKVENFCDAVVKA